MSLCIRTGTMEPAFTLLVLRKSKYLHKHNMVFVLNNIQTHSDISSFLQRVIST